MTYNELLAQLRALAEYCGVSEHTRVYVSLDPEKHPLPVPVLLTRLRFNENGIYLLVEELLS